MEALAKCFSLPKVVASVARPKLAEGEKSAYERMEDAFWSMLAEMPYHEMTGKELRGRAGVSHNTFYYHFDNMDDMARQMFERLAIPEVPLALMSTMAGGAHTVDELAEQIPDFEERFARMRLLAGSGSPLLTGLIREAIVHTWLAAMGVSEDNLTSDDRVDITYAFGGMLALFGSDLTDEPQVIAAFTQREMGQAVFRTIHRIAMRQRE